MIQTGCKIKARRPDLTLITKKEITYQLDDFTIPADRKPKIKENEETGKCLDFAKDLNESGVMELNVLFSYFAFMAYQPL